MIQIEINYISDLPQYNGKKETFIFKSDEESIIFLEQLEKTKMQNVYDKLNLGIYIKPLKYTYPSSGIFSKPITKKQRETNELIRKIIGAIDYSLHIKITTISA